MDSKHTDRTTAGTDPVEAARDDVLRKIGRNLVNFQKLEPMLKALNAQQSISGSLSELHALATNARRAVAKKTMGPLVEAFVNSVFSATPEAREHAAVKEVAVSFSFRIEANEAIAKERKKALRAVVAERNRLVHRWLAEFDPYSKDSCLRLSAELDAQHARVTPELEALKSIFTAFKDLRTGLVCYLASDEVLNAISRESVAEPDVDR